MQHSITVEVGHALGYVLCQLKPQVPGEGYREVQDQLLQCTATDILCVVEGGGRREWGRGGIREWGRGGRRKGEE